MVWQLDGWTDKEIDLKKEVVTYIKSISFLSNPSEILKITIIMFEPLNSLGKYNRF